MRGRASVVQITATAAFGHGDERRGSPLGRRHAGLADTVVKVFAHVMQQQVGIGTHRTSLRVGQIRDMAGGAAERGKGGGGLKRPLIAPGRVEAVDEGSDHADHLLRQLVPFEQRAFPGRSSEAVRLRAVQSPCGSGRRALERPISRAKASATCSSRVAVRRFPAEAADGLLSVANDHAGAAGYAVAVAIVRIGKREHRFAIDALRALRGQRAAARRAIERRVAGSSAPRSRVERHVVAGFAAACGCENDAPLRLQALHRLVLQEIAIKRVRIAFGIAEADDEAAPGDLPVLLFR